MHGDLHCGKNKAQVILLPYLGKTGCLIMSWQRKIIEPYVTFVSEAMSQLINFDNNLKDSPVKDKMTLVKYEL